MNQQKVSFLPEWHTQSAVQLTWPHEYTDWADMLDEVIPCFREIAREIAKRELLIIVCIAPEEVKEQLMDISLDNIRFFEMPTNDTWARDHGAISVLVDNQPTILDFTFNGWGMKFAADCDNQITKNLFEDGAFASAVKYSNELKFILEGGSIESDGEGTILTTSECLLSKNRNNLTKDEVTNFLCNKLGAKRVLWLDHGYLAGDDTDSHIDTLARFCSPSTIAYVKCEDKEDEHYDALSKMEKQLQSFVTSNNTPYELIALPMADEVEFEGERIPATYANFLIINGAVLLPTYNSPKDEIAITQLQKAFPDREIIGINCLPLIKQHGSLHCVTMQFPEGFVI